jgi:plasmid maintenance system killer protein
MWVSGNWRLVFEFAGAEVVNVDLVDYHCLL